MNAAWFRNCWTNQQWHFAQGFALHPYPRLPMARILITSGPTRQHLDPVRYLSNGSSGRMGKALAEAAIAAGHDAVVVSGPVGVRYPHEAEVISVVSTEEMLAACLKVFPTCAGLIAAAAPCDYRPKTVAARKIRKTGGPLEIKLVETPDIVAQLGKIRKGQWMVAFALETEDRHLPRNAQAGAEKLRLDRGQWAGGDLRRPDPGRSPRR